VSNQDQSPVVYEKFVAKILVNMATRASHTTLEEEKERVQYLIADTLSEEYGEQEVDLVWVTWEGRMTDEDDYEPGWGLSPEEMWDLLPGETQDEKKEWIKRWAREHGDET
jgi:hypothetical protein